MFTICYETEAGKVRHETSNRRAIELLGRSLTRRAENETVWNIAVLDEDGADVTFDFTCFQSDEPDRECPSCGAPADETGYRIPEHRTGCPYTVDYRAI